MSHARGISFPGMHPPGKWSGPEDEGSAKKGLECSYSTKVSRGGYSARAQAVRDGDALRVWVIPLGEMEDVHLADLRGEFILALFKDKRARLALGLKCR